MIFMDPSVVDHILAHALVKMMLRLYTQNSLTGKSDISHACFMCEKLSLLNYQFIFNLQHVDNCKNPWRGPQRIEANSGSERCLAVILISCQHTLTRQSVAAYHVHMLL